MEEMKKKRLLAMAIDFLIACSMVWVVGAIINLIVEPVPPFWMFSTICAIHFSMYWIVCKDCCKGMSPGKCIMGIQIINLKTHGIAGPLRCVARNLCYFMSFVEFIIFFVSPRGVRIGDYLTSTRVVRKDCSLRQKLIPIVFTFIVFFIIWAIGIINFYVKLEARTVLP